MQNDYETWLLLLEEQESLLRQLESDLNGETKALLSGHAVLLKESASAKEKTLEALERAGRNLDSFKNGRAKAGDGGQESLSKIFNAFAGEERKTLQDRRLRVSRLSRRVHRLNALNAQCLESQINHVRVMQSVIALASGDTLTYAADGHKAAGQSGGKLVNRSF